MSGGDLLQCYNLGCGQKYDPNSNASDACTYHPGQPIFHDAKKKWSCCKKFSTDFTEFLNIKGCTKGPHSNIRPVEPEKPKPADISEVGGPCKIPSCPVEAPRAPVTNPPPRPNESEPMTRLKVEVTPSLRKLLEKMPPEKKGGQTAEPTKDGDTSEIPIGTQCKNSGCKTTYTGTDKDSELCFYHPGVPIFHEGMKFWTCCNRKTSEFEAFMEQVGCTTGRHNWTEKAARESNLALSIAPKSDCRHDWFQLPGLVTISIYAKQVDPDSVIVDANQVKLSVAFDFGTDKQHYDKTFELVGIITPSESQVKLMGTKVEINLKKAEAMSWPRLECLPPKPSSDETNSEEKPAE
ncbi:unnamed protein product [Calicophoron daubneyi]|uniref:Cysteine and histidine-rich domain-containing protein 1 n=1 Tax=Calicophoron daubneyi TaxID=300641 RepID=A0AAV2T122_CALDB